MIFNFDPWQLDVDVEATRQMYTETDYSADKKNNTEFIRSLSSEQQRFFDRLGVDLTKVEIDKIIYDIPEDGEMPAVKLYKMTVDFLLKGKILALPQYQKEIYSDEDVFGRAFPESLKILPSDVNDSIRTYDNGIGAGIVFKHPCFHYDDSRFRDWNCGYILGTVLITQDLL